MKKEYTANSSLAKVTFSLPAEAVGSATSVILLGDFNQWDWRKGIMLDKQADGSFSKELELPVGASYQFRYVLDHVAWANDWEADGYVASPYPGVDNCVVELADAPAAAPAAKKAAPKQKKARSATKKTKGGDKLTKIEGIGPKIQGLLQEAGIDSFAKLAKADPGAIREILVAAGSRYKAFDPTTWPEQAQLAADGKWDELKTLQDELDGGRR